MVVLTKCSYVLCLFNMFQIKFKLVKEGGKPGELIVKNAEDENARIIVLGSRGQGAVRRTFLGSVSDYVAHHAHCAICVVPPEKRH